MQLGRKFTRGRSTPDDQKGQETPALGLGDGRNGRFLETINNVRPNRPGVRQLLEKKDGIVATVRNAINAKGVGLDADGNDQLVVGDIKVVAVNGLAVDGLLSGVNGEGLGVDVTAVGTENGADGFLNDAAFEGSDGGGGEAVGGGCV